ncbi:MAG: hypothetical protein KDB14_34870 [Planctomycetales bacterium]|nr:hypothetical protein [Planctomycetales bacterium]
MRAEKQQTIAFLSQHWPPADACALYDMGRRQFRELGKIPSLRAALAVYECRKGNREESEYERTAIRAVQDWVVTPSEDKRKALGRIASMQEPGYSFARNLANMASRSVAWESAIAFNLTGNPALLSADDFHTYCDAIYAELMRWATNAGDPVAELLAGHSAT